MKNLVLIIIIASAFVAKAQTKDKAKTAAVKDPKKYGYCKVTAVEANAKFHENNALVIISFIGPSNQPHKTGVRMVYNHDSLLPKLDKDGKHTMLMNAGKYQLQFFVPYWHRIISDSITIRGKHTTRIQVHFQAVDH